GSIFAREREWNDDFEPSSPQRENDRHLKADSSIRGGSIEARGGREAGGNYESSDLETNVEVEANTDSADSNLRSSYESGGRDDFGQGSSTNWESDKAQGSLRGSANWNASDDLLRDGVSDEATSTAPYEINNDASVGGAARSESGTGKSTDTEPSLRLESDFNSSEQLEENISGEFDLEGQNERAAEPTGNQPSASLIDANATDTYSSSSTSERPTDILHDRKDLNATGEADMDVEAAGAAASSEVGTSSSSTLDSTDSKFESNDPAMKKPGSPLGVAGGEPNFHYQDNRAHGVGSATSGDFATAPVNQNIEIGKSDLAQKVKGRLTRESTGTHGLMRHGVARNIQVSAQGHDVTLTGTVPSQKDKEMIEIRTREIAGVHRVNNQLIVTPEAEAAHRNVTRGSDLEDVTSEIQD
ncbi:MAG: BON domain-containing protein, partial [Limisphaerales bacterium]